MSRSAQDVLEFDKLRELLRLRTTCAPGKRVIDALEVSTNRAQLESAFALIREAREWLRLGRELGIWRAGGSGNVDGAAGSAWASGWRRKNSWTRDRCWKRPAG